jgi:hypothetical protein
LNSVGDRATGHTRRNEQRPGGDPAVGFVASRCSVVRFEKRARECVCLTSLTRVSGKAQGNRHGRSIFDARAAVFKRGESSGHDPNPDDLRVGKVKRGESRVEAC